MAGRDRSRSPYRRYDYYPDERRTQERYYYEERDYPPRDYYPPERDYDRDYHGRDYRYDDRRDYPRFDDRRDRYMQRGVAQTKREKHRLCGTFFRSVDKCQAFLFAFVAFSQREDAATAKSKFDQYNIQGRRIRIDWDIGRDRKDTLKTTTPSYPEGDDRREPPRDQPRDQGRDFGGYEQRDQPRDQGRDFGGYEQRDQPRDQGRDFGGYEQRDQPRDQGRDFGGYEQREYTQPQEPQESAYQSFDREEDYGRAEPAPPRNDWA
ncbi:hypothetical protein EDD86DRAFT_246161 [Gorgonomyces haynaldii]|nr:hypothetical protein EDD86DRAFT_246161 [Gorgonomyces haynaldii]